MFKNENEIWEAVKQLKGETIKTLTQGRPNLIVEVEDTGSMNDEIHIAERHTKPTRKDVVDACKTLSYKKELERKQDLSHLSGVSSQKSSIVFALVYYIARKDVELIRRDRRLIILLKG